MGIGEYLIVMLNNMTDKTPDPIYNQMEETERKLIALLHDLRKQLGKPKIIIPKAGEVWRKNNSYVYAESHQLDKT